MEQTGLKRVGIGMVAVVCVLPASACDSSHHSTVRGTQAARGVSDPPGPSRDGRRVAVVRRVGNVRFLEVGPAGGGPRRVIFYSRACCSDVVWAARNLIAFDDGEVKTIDVRTPRVQRIAGALDFTISGDGRWVAWWRSAGPEIPDRIGVVPITGGKCLLPPRPTNRQDTFFHPDGKRLYFLREPFGSGPVGPGRTISVRMSSLRRAPASACLW